MSPVEKKPTNEPDVVSSVETTVDTQEKPADTVSRKRERSEEPEEQAVLPAKNREGSVEGEENATKEEAGAQQEQPNSEETVEEKKALDDTKAEDSKEEKENSKPADEDKSKSDEAAPKDEQKDSSEAKSSDDSKPDDSETNGDKPKPIFGAKFSGFSFGSATTSAASVFSSVTDKPASFESLLMSGSSALDTEESKETSTANNEIGQGNTPKIDLQKVEVTTGEEGEDTLFQVRAKLFVLDAETKGWKERGIGFLKLNVKHNDKKSARLIMRTEGVLKAILNVVVFADMKCELVSEKYVRIVAFEEGQKIVQYTIKVGSKNSAEELCDAIEGVKSSLSGE
ncbi:PH domain-like protein [Basidiobolus meristosporus CBS 931.73]|uniref:PH domain-like protein n=1 Tax=Basidiobolus meristosporus CBS 931.73 TaxID=1314790 RepID=A0A1Y1YRV2_9FUNG|nr:PH domain-like protein [Basidiobolus meristosporus CBS 931.73]|eukprot:ORY00699.1 PH domain-like protein [Basidiobolus meristosporus CBS 931.73]